jgi:hypothetical protein
LIVEDSVRIAARFSGLIVAAVLAIAAPSGAQTRSVPFVDAGIIHDAL